MAHSLSWGHFCMEAPVLVDLWRKEPARIIGYAVALLVMGYAYWRGLSVEEVLVQLLVLLGMVEGIRSRVTPYIKGITHPTSEELDTTL